MWFSKTPVSLPVSPQPRPPALMLAALDWKLMQRLPGGGEQTAVDWQRVTGAAHEQAAALSVGGVYFSALRITNHLGYETTMTTDGFLVVPGAAGPWLPGPLQAPAHASGPLWPLEWAALLASSEAPHDFRVAVGTAPAADNLLPWHDVGAATSWTWDGAGAPLLDGAAYYATVQTRTGALAAARVVLDASAPVVGDGKLAVTNPAGPQVFAPAVVRTHGSEWRARARAFNTNRILDICVPMNSTCSPSGTDSEHGSSAHCGLGVATGHRSRSPTCAVHHRMP